MSTNSADQEEVMNKKNGSLLTPTVRQELARSDQVDLLDDEAKSHHIHHVNMAAAHVTDETSRNNNLHSDRVFIKVEEEFHVRFDYIIRRSCNPRDYKWE